MINNNNNYNNNIYNNNNNNFVKIKIDIKSINTLPKINSDYQGAPGKIREKGKSRSIKMQKFEISYPQASTMPRTQRNPIPQSPAQRKV